MFNGLASVINRVFKLIEYIDLANENQTPDNNQQAFQDSASESTDTPVKSGKMARSAGVVSMFTMMSRILGLIRDMVFAYVFGASAAADAFFVAFKIPNFLRRLFAEGAFSQSFVPVLSEYKVQKDKEEVKELINAVAGTLGLTLLVFSAVAIVFAPWLVIPIAPGWYANDPDKLALAGNILRLTFPYLFLISMTAFAGSVLNTYGKFAVPAFTPILLNICLISAALSSTHFFDVPVMALGWGVMAAGVAQCLFQLPFLARIGLLPRPVFNTAHEGVKRILKLMTPALFGVSVSQINLFFDTLLASFLMTGSVSWLYYSDRLVELPLGVIGIAIGTVILPNLSRKHTSQSAEAFAHTLDWAARMVLLIGIPSTIGLLLLAEPILVVLFEGGVFDDFTVMKSALSLRAYALGLLAFMLIKVLAPGYFARQDTKTPVAIGIKAMVLNMVLNLIFIFPLAHVGLALATSISAFFNVLLLYRGLRKAGVYQFQPGWPRFLLQLFLSSAFMVAVVLFLNKDISVWLSWGGMERAGHLGMIIGAASLVYFAVLWLSGFRRHEMKV